MGKNKIMKFNPGGHVQAEEDLLSGPRDLLNVAEEGLKLRQQLIEHAAHETVRLTKESGINANWEMTNEYGDFLSNVCYFPIGDAESYTIYQSVSDNERYCIYAFFSTDIDTGYCGVRYDLVKVNDGEMKLWEGRRWTTYTFEGCTGVDNSLREIYEGESPESLLMHAYLESGTAITEEAWKAICNENSDLLKLAKEGCNADFIYIDGHAYLIPYNEMQIGMAIGYRDGAYRLYQYLDPVDLMEYRLEDDDQDDFDYPFFLEEVDIFDDYRDVVIFILKEFTDEFSEAYVTIPMSHTDILRSDDYPLIDPPVLYKFFAEVSSQYARDERVKKIVEYISNVCGH